jgi:hypothetical protein
MLTCPNSGVAGRRLLLFAWMLLGPDRPAVATSVRYDVTGRMTAVVFDATRSASYDHDAFGNVTNLSFVGSFAEVDGDGDTMPDAWEWVWLDSLTNSAAGDFNQDGISNLQHFQTSTDPTDPDTDRDGISNVHERRAGTDPTNAASFLGVRQVFRSGSNVVVQWSSVASKSYRLERSTNLLAGFTVNVGTNLPAVPPVNSAIDTNVAGRAPLFYRIRLE